MKWEFAQVYRRYYEVSVTYICPNGSISTSPVWKGSKTDPVFEGILGYMGGQEWELVSVIYDRNPSGLDYQIIIAYLKRPVVDGRPTNQPPIPSKLW